LNTGRNYAGGLSLWRVCCQLSYCGLWLSRIKCTVWVILAVVSRSQRHAAVMLRTITA